MGKSVETFEFPFTIQRDGSNVVLLKPPGNSVSPLLSGIQDSNTANVLQVLISGDSYSGEKAIGVDRLLILTGIRGPRQLSVVINRLDREIEQRDWSVENTIRAEDRARDRLTGGYYLRRLEPVYAGYDLQVRGKAREIKNELSKIPIMAIRHSFRSIAGDALTLWKPDSPRMNRNVTEGLLIKTLGLRSEGGFLATNFLLDNLGQKLDLGRQEEQNGTFDIYEVIAICGITRLMSKQFLLAAQEGEMTEELSSAVVARVEGDFIGGGGSNGKVASVLLQIFKPDIPELVEEKLKFDQQKTTAQDLEVYKNRLNQLLIECRGSIDSEEYNPHRLNQYHVPILPDGVIAGVTKIREIAWRAEYRQGLRKTELPSTGITFLELKQILGYCFGLLNDKEDRTFFDLMEHIRKVS